MQLTQRCGQEREKHLPGKAYLVARRTSLLWPSGISFPHRSVAGPRGCASLTRDFPPRDCADGPHVHGTLLATSTAQGVTVILTMLEQFIRPGLAPRVIYGAVGGLYGAGAMTAMRLGARRAGIIQKWFLERSRSG